MRNLLYSRCTVAIAFPVTWMLCLCLACGSSSAVKSSSGMTRSSFDADRPYDDPPLTEAELAGRNRTTASSPVPPATQVASPSRDTIRGYRIQVYSFRDRKSADAARQKLLRHLAELAGVRVYIEEEPPYYRVRAGDFRTKAEAEQLLRLLRSRKEYRDAWIVETKVYPSK